MIKTNDFVTLPIRLLQQSISLSECRGFLADLDSPRRGASIHRIYSDMPILTNWAAIETKIIRPAQDAQYDFQLGLQEQMLRRARIAAMIAVAGSKLSAQSPGDEAVLDAFLEDTVSAKLLAGNIRHAFRVTSEAPLPEGESVVRLSSKTLQRAEKLAKTVDNIVMNGSIGHGEEKTVPEHVRTIARLRLMFARVAVESPDMIFDHVESFLGRGRQLMRTLDDPHNRHLHIDGPKVERACKFLKSGIESSNVFLNLAEKHIKTLNGFISDIAEMDVSDNAYGIAETKVFNPAAMVRTKGLTLDL